ncbi:MAG: ECF transporter S component [Bacillota bacterium]|nr:ECF transporter S component [Bacillota bacterium]MDW7678429.1 ECF transporter S component [Bacillota bacterium]
MVKIRKTVYGGSLILLLAIAAFTLWMERSFLILGFMVILLAAVPFYVRFEKKNMKAEEIVLVASLSAMAAVGRIPFAALPGVQPTSFIIIMAGFTMGPETGFIIGGTAAIVSNLFLGQGPWTPWQMIAWGLMGWTAGLLRNRRWMKHRAGLVAFGTAWGFLFGWIMNLWFVLGFFDLYSWSVWLTAFAASFYFDLAHAAANGVLLWLFSERWVKILGRMTHKFGLLK